MWLDLGEYRGPSRFHAFVMYCMARAVERDRKEAYRAYVTESLRLSPQGKALAKSYTEMLVQREDVDVDAVIEHIIDVLGTED